MNWAGSPLKPESSRASEHVDSLEFLPCTLTQFYWIFGDSAQIVMAQIIETLPWLRELLWKWDHNLLFSCLSPWGSFSAWAMIFLVFLFLTAACKNITQPGIKAAVWQDTPHLERDSRRRLVSSDSEEIFPDQHLLNSAPADPDSALTATKEKKITLFVMTQGGSREICHPFCIKSPLVFQSCWCEYSPSV